MTLSEELVVHDQQQHCGKYQCTIELIAAQNVIMELLAFPFVVTVEFAKVPNSDGHFAQLTVLFGNVAGADSDAMRQEVIRVISMPPQQADDLAQSNKAWSIE